MRQVNVFTAEPTLARELRTLEQNTADEATEIRARFRPIFSKRKVLQTNEFARFFELLLVDTSSGNLTLALPSPTPKDAGKELVVIKTASANTITMRATAGQVQGAATLALTSRGAYWFVSDGENFWREF